MKLDEHDLLITSLLYKHWGANSFRDGQREAIESILTKTDCLLVMPTGAGKSLCFQLPAMIADGSVIVISPLIALMLDQVADLNAKGISAVSLGGPLTDEYLVHVIRQCQKGKIKLLYLSPERLMNPKVKAFIAKGKIAYLVVDEAHCISQWGHQFRPAYRTISDAIGDNRTIPIIAVTATATPRVQNDICNNLGLKNAVRLIHSHDRKNLVWRVVEESSRKIWVGKHFQKSKKCGIVYVATRKNAEAVSRYLAGNGISACFYHAGMESEDRFEVQEAFLRSKLQVIVATSAFGMGINKPDIRTVVHYDFPFSFEEYVQQAGRAGRDGLDASAILLYDRRALRMQKGRIERNLNYRDRMRSQGPKPLSQLKMLEKYSELRSCRRRDILFYFGEKYPPFCGKCDNCLRTEIDAFDETRSLESEGILIQEKVGELSGDRSHRLTRYAFFRKPIYKTQDKSENQRH